MRISHHGVRDQILTYPDLRSVSRSFSTNFSVSNSMNFVTSQLVEQAGTTWNGYSSEKYVPTLFLELSDPNCWRESRSPTSLASRTITTAFPILHCVGVSYATTHSVNPHHRSILARLRICIFLSLPPFSFLR